MKTIIQFATVAALGTAVLYGQTNPDTSGSSMLKGAYRFRQVAVLNVNQNTGNPTEVATAFGVITFDGVGSFTLAGTYLDSTISGGAQQAIPSNVGTGSYGIGSNGIGYIQSPMNLVLGQIYATQTDNFISGSVAQGVFAGSDTEDEDVNDIFIAIPVSTPPTNASFTKAYTVGLLDFTGATGAAIKNALFNLTPNGAGGLAAITLNGQAANQSAATITQTITGATYNFASDGNATLTIPLPSGVTSVNALINGSKTMYVSSDGNFVLGWTNSGYDIFFGVSALTSSVTNATYQGTYFISALEDTPIGNGVDSYYGSSLAAAGNGYEIFHERLEYAGYPAYDSVTDDATQLNANGTTAMPDYNGYQYAFGDAGKAFVAIGSEGTFTLLVGTQAPVFTGSGVFLNPTGIFNAASYAPITASIAPGELLTLFGTGLSNSTLSAVGGQAFPTQLGGVQVLMNNHAAAIYYVSPTQISAIVPYSLSPSSTQSVATIQVNNGGSLSNPVTMYLTDALPGVFTQNQSGIGLGAVLHAADGSLVTVNHPAVAGEYLEVFLTGLGTVTPTITDGALGPTTTSTTTLSTADIYTSGNLGVYFDDYSLSSFQPLQGTMNFAGLAPGLAGLYQINVQVPTGMNAGDLVYLEVATDYADILQVTVPIGGASSLEQKPRSATPHPRNKPRVRHQAPSVSRLQVPHSASSF